jgi:hypothetical protein
MVGESKIEREILKQDKIPNNLTICLDKFENLKDISVLKFAFLRQDIQLWVNKWRNWIWRNWVIIFYRNHIILWKGNWKHISISTPKVWKSHPKIEIKFECNQQRKSMSNWWVFIWKTNACFLNKKQMKYYRLFILNQFLEMMTQWN